MGPLPPDIVPDAGAGRAPTGGDTKADGGVDGWPERWADAGSQKVHRTSDAINDRIM
jgi:hypothetical protein